MFPKVAGTCGEPEIPSDNVLFFEVQLPALGYATYYITKTNNGASRVAVAYVQQRVQHSVT